MEDTAPIDSPEPSAAPPSSTSIGRDQVNVSQSPGAIQRADSVAQNFGQQYNVNTGGGTYTAIHYHGVSAPLPLAPAVLAAAQAHLAAMPLGTVPQVAALPPGSRMPLAPNPLFVGRSDELQTLARALVQGPSIAAIAAATGLGGIGKTQLASDFVHRYGQYFAGGVCWMSFASAGSVPAEIVVCGGPGGMNVPGFGTLPFDQQVECVQQAWQCALPRLLIFDNCEDEALLSQWRPPTGDCRVLVTSRRTEWDDELGVQALPLRVLPRTESITLLRKYRPDRPADAPELDAIAAESGNLPLALHLAGSYLKNHRHDVTPEEYLAELRSPALLEHPSLAGEDLTYTTTKHVLNVGRTFALSYDQLEATKPVDGLALALLARAAYFAPGEPIARELLKATMGETTDTRLVGRALRWLVNLGLLEEEEAGTLRLHRLLAAFVQSLQSDVHAQSAVERMIDRTADRLNQAGIPAPLVAIQAHLRHVADVARERADERAAMLCHRMGRFLRMIGDYTDARAYVQQALAIRREVLGERHPDTATSLNNLGMLLRNLGDLEGARAYVQQALAIRREVLGERHPDTALILNNLGLLLKEQGDLAGARPYLGQARFSF